MKNSYLIFISILLFSVLFVSCQIKSKDKAQIYRDSTILNPVALNIKEKLPFDLLNPTGLFLTDSIIVLLLRHEEKMIKVYDRNSYALKGEILSKGKGPQEVNMIGHINQWEEKDGNLKIFIQDYPVRMAWLDINKSLTERKTIFEPDYDLRKEGRLKITSKMRGASFALDEGSFLTFQYPFKIDKPNHVDYKANPLLVEYNYAEKKERKIMTQFDFKRSEIESEMIFSGSRVISDDKKHMLHACGYLDCLIFYDLEAQKKKQLYMSRDSENYLLAQQKPKQYYKQAISAGVFCCVLKESTIKGINSIVQFFTWNGEVKLELHLKEKVKYFDVDTKTKQLFAIIYNEESTEDEIVIYDNLPL